jgi:hypothetical protein
VELIEERGVDTFYVGNNGAFDRAVLHALKLIQTAYAHIRYAVVLDYLPTTPQSEPTLYPEGLELVPRRFAIDRRNRWMVEQAEFLITYVIADYGGAAKFQSLAQRQGKTVINLAERQEAKE